MKVCFIDRFFEMPSKHCASRMLSNSWTRRFEIIARGGGRSSWAVVLSGRRRDRPGGVARGGVEGQFVLGRGQGEKGRRAREVGKGLMGVGAGKQRKRRVAV